jgi:hypothetical protein
MDMRYERLRYFHSVSRKTRTGLGYFEPWHPHGATRGPRIDRYKNIDRATIRKRDPKAGEEWPPGLAF